MAVLLTALVLPVLFAFYESRLAFRDEGTGGQFAVEDVSLINLIATPERYDGRWVRVEGVCAFEFEGNALYLSRADRKHALTRNAIWASYDTLGAGLYDLPFTFKFGGRHVLLEGHFSSRDKGHMGMFSGALTNVNRIMTK